MSNIIKKKVIRLKKTSLYAGKDLIFD